MYVPETPLMAKSDLYKISGHWDHYMDGMFVLGDEESDDKEVYGTSSDDLSVPVLCIQERSSTLTEICLTEWVRLPHCSEMRIPERCMDLHVSDSLLSTEGTMLFSS